MSEPTNSDAPDAPVLSAVPPAVASADVSAAATPGSLPPLDDEERSKSIKVSLADLTAKANALYASEKFEDASELFSQASEMQSELNGEMSPENADILFLYGRSLFRVGQLKSDVLGPTGAATTKKQSGASAKPKAPEQPAADADEVAAEAAEGVAAAAEKANGSASKDGKDLPEAKKPLFSFTGDEEFEGSDEEEEGDEGEEEEEDDLAVAFEILDLARVLFEKALEQDTTNGKGKEKDEGDDPAARHAKERLGDTHDLLAEISLENAKFPEAAQDFRASLAYKQDLYPVESEIIAEIHYKLSLALDFASKTQSSDDQDDDGPKELDQALRDESKAELEKAINSTKLKLKNKEVELAMVHAPEDNEVTRKQISNVKEVLADMEQRLVELSKPPMDVDSMLAGDNPLSGILGAALGESAAATAARVDEAKKNATDLSGLVRRKPGNKESEDNQAEKQSEAPAEPVEASTNGKRKAEEPAADEEDAKKTKIEDQDAGPGETAA